MQASNELIAISRKYGGNSEYVLAGGGNTSIKNAEFMWVKASGFPLDGIAAEGFVRMRMDKLKDIWQKTYPSDSAEREALAAADLLDARDVGEEDKRPSVESLLHALFQEKLVIHTHPSKVNGLTCGVDGKDALNDLFGKNALWVPTVNPGYILAKTVKTLYDSHGGSPNMVFLQNHGVFVMGETESEIDKVYQQIDAALSAHIVREPKVDSAPIDEREKDRVITEIKAIMAVPHVAHRAYQEVLEMAKAPASMHILQGSFSPDHIVYCSPVPAYIRSDEGIKNIVGEYTAKYGYAPKTFVAEGLGIFAASSSRQAAAVAVDVLTDAVKVAVYSLSFGGPQFMPEDQVQFIVNWEVERYRKKISTGE